MTYLLAGEGTCHETPNLKRGRTVHVRVIPVCASGVVVVHNVIVPQGMLRRHAALHDVVAAGVCRWVVRCRRHMHAVQVKIRDHRRGAQLLRPISAVVVPPKVVEKSNGDAITPPHTQDGSREGTVVGAGRHVQRRAGEALGYSAFCRQKTERTSGESGR